MTEIIVTVITSISGIVVAVITHKRLVASKETKKEVTDLKANQKMQDLLKEKDKEFEAREEVYNELTVAIARNIVHGTSKELIERKLCECVEADSRYEEARSECISEMESLVDKIATGG